MATHICPHCKKEYSNKKQLRACVFSHLKEEETKPEEVQEQVVEEEPEAAYYVKRPVVVQAYQTEKKKEIETLEGTVTANPGDWVITGVMGEQYPVKPEIFEKTYDICDGEIAPVILPASMCPPELEYLSINQTLSLKVQGLLTEDYDVIVQNVEFVRW